ncbi:ras-related and estrogen-regulated growth inhibitor-like protein, partial [Leptotrombidium deliense]
MYKKEHCCDDVTLKIEILDVSSRCKIIYSREKNTNLTVDDIEEHIQWANAFVVIYSICDKNSFLDAQRYIEIIIASRRPSHSPIALLANKRDLEPGRQVTYSEGNCLAQRFQCHFYEISAAESYFGVFVAWEALIREVRAIQWRPHRFSSLSGQNRKLCKVFGAVFGRHSDASVSYSHYSSNQRNNNNENRGKQKRSISVLSVCRPKKHSNAIMIRITKESMTGVLSL